jgi:hypothetical protein
VSSLLFFSSMQQTVAVPAAVQMQSVATLLSESR